MKLWPSASTQTFASTCIVAQDAVGHASELPALQWKLLNLRKLRYTHVKRFAAQHDELRKHLEHGHTR
jgi:hypothetical protein